MNEAYEPFIDFDRPYAEAKAQWNTLCESLFVFHALAATHNNKTLAAKGARVDRKHLRRLLKKYEGEIAKVTDEQKRVLPVSYNASYKDAKTTWLNAFEVCYFTHAIHASGGNKTQAARQINLDRKYFRHCLQKKKIGEYQQPQEETKHDIHSAKLRRRFYNGVNFERGMIAYLFFEGKSTTRSGVKQIAKILGGDYHYLGKFQFGAWNRLQVTLSQLGILIATTNCSVYNWNYTLVPIEYEHALTQRNNGMPLAAIIAYHFPKDECEWNKAC